MKNPQTIKASLIGLLTLTTLATCGTRARAADAEQQTADKQTETKIRVTIYPLLAKAPIFGASVDLPNLPSAPGSGGAAGSEGDDQSGTTDTSLNAAYMGGILIEASRWFAEAFGTWANLSATRVTPRLSVTSDALFFGARGGVRLAGGLSATGGVRRATIDLDATLNLPILDKTIEGHAKPGIWDPLIGIDWRRRMGSWTIDGNVQGGGFGVGADVDISAELHARWRVVKHVELRAGYSLLYFKLTVADVSIGSFQRTLVVKQSLNGPEFGLGIVF
jgi:hypothetical protein